MLRQSFDPDGPNVHLVAGGFAAKASKAAGALMELHRLLFLREARRQTAFACLAMPGDRAWQARTGGTPEAYVALTDEKGLPLDPFLAFVVSGWAVRPTLRVLRDGYPPDQASSGHGVSAVHPLDDLDGPIAEAAAQVARLAGALGLDQAGTPRAS